ncbi:hypothetical protein SAMN04487996_1162 [Dyadobacter soli]|uniref:Uncharacterized protein n=1 Tax=Dyadobacter soli TaxID=659014 RepID=A0A1G7S4H1_9BACT|nr:hypothetical protein SAMN04487996_1162 [Dyadobacter soli]
MWIACSRSGIRHPTKIQTKKIRENAIEIANPRIQKPIYLGRFRQKKVLNFTKLS